MNRGGIVWGPGMPPCPGPQACQAARALERERILRRLRDATERLGDPSRTQMREAIDEIERGATR